LRRGAGWLIIAVHGRRYSLAPAPLPGCLLRTSFAPAREVPRMGVYVQSRIIAERIEPEAWQALYAQTLDFLNRCSLDLMGLGRVKGRTGDRRVYTRAIEQHADEPARRHWHVVGDFESFETGESFLLYADIGHYRRGEAAAAPEDVLQAVLVDAGSSGNVFNDKTQGHPYHFAMLAVAMLIEDRFPLYAFTSGDIDRAQAEAAREMLRETLGVDVALPLCVESGRLLERIGNYVQGQAVLERFDVIFRGERSELFRVAPPQDLQAWLAAELGRYQTPSQLGVTRLAIDWLNADQDLETLCRVACLDAAGPRFDPVGLAEMLASTWVTVPEEARAALSPFQRPAGAQDTVATQLGMALLDMRGLSGRRTRRCIPRAEVLALLARLFPEQAERIRETLEQSDAKITANLETVRTPVQDLDRRSHEQRDAGDGRSFLFFETADDLDESQRTPFKWFAYTAWRLLSTMAVEVPLSIDWTPTEVKNNIERICREHGITLTEDAWTWVEAEQDQSLLNMLLAFAAMNEHEQRFWNMRRALFERRPLALALLAASRDEAVRAEVEEMLALRQGQ
jgi:hypothetical protein